MGREFYATRMNQDGTRTVYRAKYRYWQGRVSSMGAAQRRRPRILR